MVKRERHGEEVLTDEQDEQDGEGVGRKRAQNTQKGGRGHHNLMGDAFADFRHKGKGKIGRIMAGQNHILVKSAGQAKELCPQIRQSVLKRISQRQRGRNWRRMGDFGWPQRSTKDAKVLDRRGTG